MKNFLSLLVVLISFSLFEGVFAGDPPPGGYAWYQKNVKDFCALEGDDAPANKATLWMDQKEQSLIKINRIDYPEITNDNPDASYEKTLTAIKSDKEKLKNIGLLTSGYDYLWKASYVYKEVMSAIYACGVMNAKVRIIENTLKIPMAQSNIKKNLTTQLKRTKEDLGKKGCLGISDKSELSMKKVLLDNTTYQYCNYRQYLYYLDETSKKSIQEYTRNKSNENAPSTSILTNTDSAAIYLARTESEIASEIIHTKEVFPQAMIAFTEFERTYAPHIILQFILQDYIELRTSLKQLLNPIGQVIYKASNAQSPK